MRISAVVLAGGASRRMGKPKALVTIGGKTFLEHVVHALRAAGIDEIVVVLGASADRIRDELTWFDGKVVVNENWCEGQLSSIIAGINHLRETGAEAMILCPVDHPLISPELIQQLCVAFSSSGKKIGIPVYQGKRGHPVLFSSDLFTELTNAPRDVGARAVLWSHGDDILEVIADDEGVVLNIDTPEGLDEAISRRSAGKTYARDTIF